MLMAEQEPYALMVQPDDMLISPREVGDNFGTMVCFHPRYALGDHHNYVDKDDFLREMYLNTVGNNERGMERYRNMILFHNRFLPLLQECPKNELKEIADTLKATKELMLKVNSLRQQAGLSAIEN